MLETCDDFLTVEELCELLKIGHNAAYTLLNSGKPFGMGGCGVSRNRRSLTIPAHYNEIPEQSAPGSFSSFYFSKFYTVELRAISRIESYKELVYNLQGGS